MKRLASLVAVTVAALWLNASASAAPLGAPARPGSIGASTIAVYGDAPYGTATKILAHGTIVVDQSQFNAMPGFLDTINQDPDVSLVAHVGDIHAGKQFCTQSYDQSIYSQWTALQDP